MVGVTRRGFIRATGALGVTLTLGRLQLGCEEAAAPSETFFAEIPAYDDWSDLYRQRFTWDSVHKSTHHVNCWYQRGCNWNVYVKDGVVFREEQAATYEQTNPEVPDYNPRGCNKGACFSERMYDGSRLRHPLKRVGPRGAGRWRRVSWEEALRDDRRPHHRRAGSKTAPAPITWDPGTANASNGCNTARDVHRTGLRARLRRSST